MPAPKPSVVIAWGATAALIATPSGPKISAGWDEGEFPPADWWNYVWKNHGDWSAYLRDFEAIAHTWTAAQSFAAGIDVTGPVNVNGAIAGTSLAISAGTVLGGALGVAGLATLSGGATVPTGQVLTLAGSSKIHLSDNPAANVAILNELHAKNLIKAWGYFTTGNPPALRAGMNIASVTASTFGAAPSNKVTFAQAMADANFVPIVVAKGTAYDAYADWLVPAETDSFHVLLENSSSRATVNPQAVSADILFVVLGTQ